MGSKLVYNFYVVAMPFEVCETSTSRQHQKAFRHFQYAIAVCNLQYAIKISKPSIYSIVHKIVSVVLRTSLAWPDWAGCSRAELFSQVTTTWHQTNLQQRTKYHILYNISGYNFQTCSTADFPLLDSFMLPMHGSIMSDEENLLAENENAVNS